jgi:hypothetical protein
MVSKRGINGHEQNIPDNDDLQYACIFRLPTAKICALGDSGCDCSATKDGDATAVTTANSPVCQPPAGGPAGTTQYYAKAYPGLRELDVVHDLGSRGVPASICPKTLVQTVWLCAGLRRALEAHHPDARVRLTPPPRRPR